MASHGIPRVSATSVDKSDKAKEKEQKQIEQYKGLEKDVVERIKAKDLSNATLQATSKLLTRNPEYYTIWNHRRLILQHAMAKELAPGNTPTADPQDEAAARKAGHTVAQQEILLLVKEDLQFLIPILKQYPKCYWIWNHRSWLLATATTHVPTPSALQLWQGELALVSKMLALDGRNFHGWGYRRAVVAALQRLSGDKQQSMVESEFAYTTKMIQTDLSNFSAWHSRSQLIPRLLEERQASSAQRKELLDAEFDLITRALYTDPYDQSLWFYHQYLMSTLDLGNAISRPTLQPCTDVERLHYLEQQLGTLQEMLDGAEDCKYIYQAVLEYSQRGQAMQGFKAKFTRQELLGYLGELRKIDPLREGRWKDLEVKLSE